MPLALLERKKEKLSYGAPQRSSKYSNTDSFSTGSITFEELVRVAVEVNERSAQRATLGGTDMKGAVVKFRCAKTLSLSAID